MGFEKTENPKWIPNTAIHPLFPPYLHLLNKKSKINHYSMKHMQLSLADAHLLFFLVLTLNHPDMVVPFH